jgi:hypothetical protein
LIAMNSHEQKYCPRCNALIECKVGSILLCQCAAVELTDAERDYLNRLYDDCLCAKCMAEIRSEFHNGKLLTMLKRLMRK